MVQIHYGYLFDFSLLCVFKRSLKKSALDDAKSHTFLGGCIVTLVAFVWLFSTVCNWMSPKFACLRGGIVALVAFVWLFATVGSQIARRRGCIVTLVAFVDFSPRCVFKWAFKLPARDDAKSHWLHLFCFSPLCVFKCALKWPAWEDAYSHWLHLFDFFPLCVFKCVFKALAWEDA